MGITRETSGKALETRKKKKQVASLSRGANTLTLKNKKLFAVYFRETDSLQPQFTEPLASE